MCCKKLWVHLLNSAEEAVLTYICIKMKSDIDIFFNQLKLWFNMFHFKIPLGKIRIIVNPE